jgi:lysozyme
MNTQTLEDRMVLMEPAELQKFAAMHKNDPYILPLALKISDMRNKLKVAEGMKYAGVKQPTIADQGIAGMDAQQAPQQAAPQVAAAQLPESTGIAPLNAPNIQGMADGGIAGYAAGTPKGTFNVDAYMNNPNVQKYLAYLNAYEGKPKPNQLVGYKSFDDLSDHPNQRVRFGKNKNQVSTAAGSYQILKRSWDEQKKKLGLEDFSLENQQRAAIGLLKDGGALEHVAKGEFQKANEKAKNIWASLPGSTIGKETGQRPRVKPELEAALESKDGIERLATTQPATQPRRVMPREEKFGLDPKLAQFFTQFMPGAEAQASELPPTSVSQLPVIPEANRSNTLSGKVNGPAATAPSAPPAKIEKGMFEALKDRVANASKSGIMALPSLVNPNVGKLLHNNERTIPAESPTTAEIRSIETGKKETPRPAQKVYEPSLMEKMPGYPVAAIAAGTEMLSPWTGAANVGISRLLGDKDKSYEQAMNEMTYKPGRPETQAALDDIHSMIEKSKLPPYFDVPGAMPMRRDPQLITKGEQGARVARAAEADAALARQKAAIEGPKQGELDLGPGGSQAGLSTDAALRAQQKMYQDAVIAAEAKRAQTDAARAKGAQGELFETGTNTPPVEMVNPKYERARIANDIRNEQAAEVANTAKAGQDARLKQAATEKLKADDSVKAGDYQLTKQNENRRAYEEIMANNAGNRTLGQGIGLTSVGGLGLKGQLPEKKAADARVADAPVMPAPEDLTKKEKKDVVAEVKASPEGKEIKKTGLDLTDKDWLNMGLNLLSAKSEGQQGLQGFLSNVGTAGTATLAQKQDREKAEAAKAFQDIQGRYYETIAGNIGKPQGEERIIRAYQSDPDFAAAYDKMQSTKTDRFNIAGAMEVWRKDQEMSPKENQMPFEQWLQKNYPSMIATQQAAITPEVMEIYNRVMKKGA